MRKLLLYTIVCCIGSVLALQGQMQTAAYVPTTALATHHIKLNTSLTGKVEAPTASHLTVRYLKNTISFDEEILSVPLLADNTFSLSFRLESPTTFHISYGKETIQLFVEPDDQLSLAFAGDDFFNSLELEGIHAEQNAYLVSAQRQFKNWDQDFMTYETTTRSAMNFRSYLDQLHQQKALFLKRYSATAKKQFTAAFLEYAQADIDYWWAYHLMNYRMTHPLSKGKTAPMQLPKSYYSFFSELKISNDKALSNKYYLDFLEEYLKLQQENITASKTTTTTHFFTVEAPLVTLLPKPDHPTAITAIRKGARLKYLNQKSDFKSKGKEEGDLSEDFWYKVETAKGKKGWVLGIGLQNGNRKLQEKITTHTASLALSKIEHHAVTKLDRLELRSLAYDEKSIICYLGKNTQLEYLQIKTSEHFTYEIKGTRYRDLFCKVRTQSGKEGWIPRSGISLQQRKVKNTPSTKTTVLTNTNQVEKYLDGKALQYVLAKSLYWKTHQNKLDDLGREIAEFRANNPYKTYTKIVTAAYEIAQLRGKGDKKFVLDSYAYSVVKLYLIAGVRAHASNEARPVFANQTDETAALASSSATYVKIDASPTDRPTTITRLTGQMQLAKSQKATLIVYTDPILFQEKRYDLAHNFDITIPLSEPVAAVLECGGERVPLYLEPGDQLEIEALGNRLIDALKYGGKGSEQNSYLLGAQKHFNVIDKELGTKIRHANADEFTAFMKKSVKKKHQFRKKRLKNAPFTANFKAYIEADITYWYAFNLLNYTVEHPLYHDAHERLALSEEYYSFLKEIPLATDNALPNEHYTYFLKEYFDYLLDQETYKGTTTKELAKRQLEGEAYYYYQAKELAIACKRGKALEAGPEIAAFIEECPHERFNDILRFTYNEAKGLLVGDDAPNFTLKDAAGKEVSLSDFRGKVVYLDFWATWCAPCVRYLHQSQKLKKQFDGKDVVFLYISLDENMDDWAQYLQGHQLAGVHVHAHTGGVYQSEIAKLYKVKQLPTFILVDKTGKIAFNPAKNPSNSQLVTQINSLLVKKERS